MSKSPKAEIESIKDLDAGFLTVRELATLLRISTITVYRRYETGKMPGGQKCGGRVIFSKRAIATWIASNSKEERSSALGRRGAHE